MTYIYYEPFEDKFYLSEWQVGGAVKYLHKATDGEYTCSWYFNNDNLRFYYIGTL